MSKQYKHFSNHAMLESDSVKVSIIIPKIVHNYAIITTGYVVSCNVKTT